MTFAHPQLLWLLALPAALLLATAFLRARASADKHPKISRAEFRPSGLLFHPSALLSPRPLAAALALAALIAALARPQGATLSTPSFTQARDVLVAVDVSRSMLADDVAPDRLARAQLLVRNLADELRGERLGLLPFAGTAFLQSPLSADYEIFRTFLDELGPDMIPAGGSDFAALLRAADEAFGPANDSPAPDAPPPPDRFLVVLSDGEAESDAWRPLAEKLAPRGVRVLALGLGTAAGAMIPDGQGGLVKDQRGAVVLTRLNPATLQDLARLTDGAYRDASSWVDLPALLRETIARGRATRVATDTAPRRHELFPWFLAPALAFLLLSLVREFPAVPRVSAKSLRPASSALVRAIPLALALHAVLFLTPWSLAEAPDATAPDPLVDLVGRLASAPDLSASDLARLATLTADQAEKARAASSATPSASFPEGAIRDALAGVSAGQAADPQAADWPALRKRLEALLAPPPQQQQQQPRKNEPKPDQQKPDQNQKSSEQSDSSPSSESSDDSGTGSPQSQQNPSDSKSSPSSDSKSADPSSTESSNSAPPAKPDASKPLGDLASDSEKKPGADKQPAPAPSDQAPSDSPDEPKQQAGGISSSGRSANGDSSADAAALDPSLVVPQQRLDRVRESDAPARLFQLLQESETPPEARERRAAGTKQTW